MATTNLINEEHLGTEATKAEAEALVAALRERGFDVRYGVGGAWRFDSSEDRIAFERAFDEEAAQLGGKINVSESTDGEGLVVSIAHDGDKSRRYLPYTGGEWELLSDGTPGRQLVGTLDVRVPRDLDAARAWAADYYGELAE